MYYKKSLYLFVSLALVVIGFGFRAAKAGASDGQGIFLTWQDYRDQKLTRSDKLSLNHLLSGKCINYNSQGAEMRYCKDSIFGYRDAKGNDYRFFRDYNDEYQILENKYMVIYATYVPTHTAKGLSLPLQPKYFFSKDLSSDILPLSLLNLKATYPDNHEFHHLLDDAFGSGRPLSEYDKKSNMRKINYLLNKSLNK